MPFGKANRKAAIVEAEKFMKVVKTFQEADAPLQVVCLCPGDRRRNTQRKSNLRKIITAQRKVEKLNPS